MRQRTSILKPVYVVGAASIFVVGIAIAAQNQPQPNPQNPQQPNATQQENQPQQPNAQQPKKPQQPQQPNAAQQPQPNAQQPNAAQQPQRPNAAQPQQPGAAQPRPNQPQNAQPRPNQPQQQPQNAQQRSNQAGEQQAAAALGAQIESQGNQGLVVTNVEQSGIWARSGLRQNDRIISVQGRTINNPRQVEAFLWSQPGQQIPVIIDRGGQRYTIQVMMPQHDENGGWVGINLDEGDADEKGEDVKGAKVTQVYPSGPASRAGIQPGDVIIKIDDKPVESAADAVLLVRELKPQAKAEFVVLRDKEEAKITVLVGSRATSGYQQSFYRGPSQQVGYQQGQQFQGQQGQQFQGQQGQGQQGFAGNEQYQGGGNNQFQGIPPHAMQMEHHRRMAEQNERIETELQQLREEIKKLREVLEKK